MKLWKNKKKVEVESVKKKSETPKVAKEKSRNSKNVMYTG